LPLVFLLLFFEPVALLLIFLMLVYEIACCENLEAAEENHIDVLTFQAENDLWVERNLKG
jgi:hypothetical protein